MSKWLILSPLNKPVSNSPVGNVSIDNREDEIGSLLSRGLSIDFADFFPVSLVVWVNIEGDIICYDAVGV